MKNDTSIKNWLKEFHLDHPLVIAGPCSAETEEQVLKIAHELKNTDTSVMRAGIWKPRTRPGNFEGVGAIGLEWLKKAKEETGLKIATEVANKTHVDLALKADVDVLWVGARSTVSPFIVQEIADALKGTDKVVLIKNPVNPDLALWLGAVERFYNADIRNLGVIHRGFSTYEKIKYRNNPEWQIAVELQKNFPDLPLIVDPSHIAGNRDLVFDICQTALDLNYDGIMVETHHTPNKAWSDAAQQITPEMLDQMTKDLRIRNKSGESAFNEEILRLRSKVDVVDDQIFEAISKRMKIVDQIGELKKENNVAIFQPERWNAILDRLTAYAKDIDLSEDFTNRFLKAIHQESIQHQHKIINKENK
ncbi:bifunctional 3-deoxy-7-phosphoheptulonate synthase/chorismate mutase type II [Psychroflexus halocasei]|uniref:chorismate mutase n=1 Tax=Psychroflexus halocasei TaxID=908615 RepID=A0A1H3ZP74_9FLAO|nr:bifunctional 3-deoxy-7-phosphoheptulonate synthase/chorismate mutase type II [Psychroflexus halocasei]SEA25032.1 3-deoxy-D-arabinoheptulosonate-7-phosphate synthase [Psychroflexus halocasei]